jgi:hypothetical protein
MELTLRGIRINKQLSEETTCFSATIYIDGKKAGRAANRGQGGPNDIDWTDYGLSAVYLAWLDKEVMPVDTYDGKIELLETASEKLDHLIDAALNDLEEKKWFQIRCRGKVLFRLTTDTDPDSWRTVKGAYSPAIKAWLVSRYGDQLGEIANETKI